MQYYLYTTVEELKALLWFVTKQTIGETVPETVLFKGVENHVISILWKTPQCIDILFISCTSRSFKLGLWLTTRTLKANHLTAPLSLQVDYRSTMGFRGQTILVFTCHGLWWTIQSTTESKGSLPGSTMDSESRLPGSTIDYERQLSGST